jgi:HlyD family secretion protein
MSKLTFRKAALNALSSPEALNQVLVVTKPTSWLALAALGVVVVSAFIWGILGSVPTVVEARGILVQEGGVTTIAAMGQGTLYRIIVAEGDTVQDGDTIAIIDVPDLRLKLENCYAAVRDADSVYTSTLKSVSMSGSLRSSTNGNVRNERSIALKAAQDKLANEEKQCAAIKDLLERGLVTNSEYFAAKENLLLAQQAVVHVRTTELQDKTQDIQASFQNEQELIRAKEQLATAIRAANEIQLQYNISRVATANHGGIVTQISAPIGALVTAGTPLVSIEHDIRSSFVGNRLSVAIFVPPAQGKKIVRGMRVRVVPTNVEASEFGSIEANTVYVSDFPLDANAVRRYINNDALSTYFSVQQEPPIGVIAELIVDKNNTSGFKWTSGRGPNTRITSGSICTCSIIVNDQRPIALLLPWLKKFLGISNG